MSINKFMRLVNLSVLAAIACLGILVLASAGAEAATRTQVQRWIVEEAGRTRVPVSLALAIAKVESNFRDGVLGRAGERGVMQIMPATARGEFGISAARLWDGRLNVKLGIRYLERLYTQYGERWDLALSHYNGGTLKGPRLQRDCPFLHPQIRRQRSALVDYFRTSQCRRQNQAIDGSCRRRHSAGRYVCRLLDVRRPRSGKGLAPLCGRS